MKKIKFAAQIFILAASFPVLFISGISTGKKTTPGSTKQEQPAIKKDEHKENCVCINDTQSPNGVMHQLIFNN